MILEVCCGDLQSVRAAKEGGAQRVELCRALELDGLTPSEAMMEEAIGMGIPVQVVPMQIVMIIVITVALSFAITVYPSIRAAKQSPIESLRYE